MAKKIHEDAMCGSPCGEEPLGCAKCMAEQGSLESAQRVYEAQYAYACGYHD